MHIVLISVCNRLTACGWPMNNCACEMAKRWNEAEEKREKYTMRTTARSHNLYTHKKIYDEHYYLFIAVSSFVVITSCVQVTRRTKYLITFCARFARVIRGPATSGPCAVAQMHICQPRHCSGELDFSPFRRAHESRCNHRREREREKLIFFWHFQSIESLNRPLFIPVILRVWCVCVASVWHRLPLMMSRAIIMV